MTKEQFMRYNETFRICQGLSLKEQSGETLTDEEYQFAKENEEQNDWFFKEFVQPQMIEDLQWLHDKFVRQGKINGVVGSDWTKNKEFRHMKVVDARKLEKEETNVVDLQTNGEMFFKEGDFDD